MKAWKAAMFAAIATFSGFAADMASQKWVKMLLGETGAGVVTNESTLALIGSIVSRDVADSLSVTKAISPIAVDAGTNGTIYASFEPATEAALSVTNSSNLVITNGTLFAWADNGVYTNAQISSAIFATKTNFVWSGRQSTVVNGTDTFPAPHGFAVRGWYITQSQAKSLKGEK